MVQNGSVLVQNNTKYENGQNSSKITWANDLIFEYIIIFWTNIFICKDICWFFLWRIYSDIHSWCFHHATYIWIFICPISMVTNIFRYSFVQKRILVPHCFQSKGFFYFSGSVFSTIRVSFILGYRGTLEISL